MDLGTAIVLGIWGALAVSVILRLRRRGAAAFDDRFSPDDRRLVGAAAFYLGAPMVILASHLAQIAALRALDNDLGHFETYVYWGTVTPADPALLTPLGRATVAALAPLSVLLAAGAVLVWTRRRPANAARNHLRIELARALSILALGLHPMASLLTQSGDFSVMREALNELRPSAGDAALLLYGVFAAWGFWRWRHAHRLALLASPLHDAARGAGSRLEGAPDDPDALRALGAAQLASGDAASIETLERARALADDDPRVALLLGRAHLEHGDPREASEQLRHAGALLEASDAPDQGALLFEVTLALSAARVALGDAEGAILTAEAARASAPRDPRGLLMHADALLAGGHAREARQRLERALDGAHGALRAEIQRRLRECR